MRIAILVTLVLLSLTTTAQKISFSTSMFCAFDGGKENLPCKSELNMEYDLMPDSNTVYKTVSKVLKLNGLDASVPEIGIIDNPFIIGMYCKPGLDQKPKIMINRICLNNYWMAMGITLHELGHLMNHHENLCSNPTLEAYADLYAGRSMAMLNATREQAVVCLDAIKEDKNNPDKSYPSKAERAKRILQGYDDYFRSVNSELSFTSLNSMVRWDKKGSKIIVYIDGVRIDVPATNQYKVFKGGQIDPEYGVLFLDSTNAAYQLLDLSSRSKGIGTLVNDRTTLTYMRTPKNSFRFYNKAKVVIKSIKDFKDDIREGNGIDYEVHYRMPGETDFKRVVLLNYFYLPDKILMPAFIK